MNKENNQQQNNNELIEWVNVPVEVMILAELDGGLVSLEDLEKLAKEQK